MAYRWRFRHKLILAHGLVVAIVLLLLGSTLYGVASYRATTRTFDKKLVELQRAEVFRSKVKSLPETSQPNDVQALQRNVEHAENALDDYDKKIKEFATQGQEIPYANDESTRVDALRTSFEKLRKALLEIEPGVDRIIPVAKDEHIEPIIDSITQQTDDLVEMIYSDLYSRVIDGGKEDARGCLYFVLTVTGIGILLMSGSLRFFYRWIFYPIRDLQLGVDRVAKGDFKHHIRIQSSDEIQDLAKAFNEMTHRLDETYTDLARQVNERSRQLVRSERLASVGFLAAGVAHEINNPLASIAFCSEALERRIFDMLAQIPPSSVANEESAVIRKYLKMIQQESFRCKEITSRLLEFSRGGERRREPTDLGELVQGVLDMVQHLQNRSGKNLVFEPAEQIIALVNAQEIKSVIVNLVVNALDSMEEGGTLAISLGVRDGMAELVFQDTGCGMTGEVLENIFEPFYTRSRTGKGTGLGLSICHRIISQHQGEIEASSPGPNRGSTFVVRLPLSPSNDAREHRSGPKEAHAATLESIPQHGRRAAA